ITGPLHNGDVTDDDTPTLSGTGKPGDTIGVIVDGNEVGNTVVDDNGNWTWTPDQPLAEGPHDIDIVVKDPAGNTSPPSDTITVIVDTTPPDAPVITAVYDDQGGKTGNLVAGETTDDDTPTVSGTAEPHATVLLLDNGKEVGRTTADATGNWTLEPTLPLANGNHTLTTQAIDKAGNVSAPSTGFDFVLANNGQPSKPDIKDVIVEDDKGSITGPLHNGDVTDDDTPTLSGTGKPGDTIGVIVDGNEVGNTVVDDNGNWTWTPDQPLAEGPHDIDIVVKDPAGNTSPPSDTITVIVDTTPPTPPYIASVYDDQGSKTGNLVAGETTDDDKPTVSGIWTEPNATVVLYDNGKEVGRTTADATGNWTLEPNHPLAQGPHVFTAQAIDSAGNVSGPSTGFHFTVAPLVKPSAPTIDSVYDDEDTRIGYLNPGDITDDWAPLIQGSATPGVKVNVYANNELIGSTIAGTDGKWSFDRADLDEGQVALTARAESTAGNLSDPSAPFDLILDFSAPQRPYLERIVDDIGTVQGTVYHNTTTDDRTPTLVGIGQPGDRVIVRDNGTVIGETWVDDQGGWSFTPSTPLSEGRHDFNAKAITANGRESGWMVDDETIFVDLTPPQPPVILTLQDNSGHIVGEIPQGGVSDEEVPIATGSAEPFSTITMYNALGNVVGQSKADASGFWRLFVSVPLELGAQSLTVTATDKAGNTSQASLPREFTKVEAGIPSKPVIEGVYDDQGRIIGSVPHEGLTDDTHPLVYGTAQPGTLVKLYSLFTLVGEVFADQNGHWELELDLRSIGTYHNLSARSFTPAGNFSEMSDSYIIYIDTTVPSAPSAEIYDDVGPKQGELGYGETTDDAMPLIVGRGREGDSIFINVDGTVIAEVKVSPQGEWRYAFDKPLSDGLHIITFQAMSEVGAMGKVSEDYRIIVETSSLNGGRMAAETDNAALPEAEAIMALTSRSALLLDDVLSQHGTELFQPSPAIQDITPLASQPAEPAEANTLLWTHSPLDIQLLEQLEANQQQHLA
ncbi:Ig-like domain-containing protein, partial [Metapseudomonas otitidis]|uniref:Ig-like domain-containing protein n=2 Tax=Pseudomonadaceae TaxID=135621 RepID=UPI001F1093F8